MPVQSIIDSSGSYELLKEGIKASTLRAQAISNNIANINTKDYKGFNVIFEENLNGTNDNKLSMRKTDERHIDKNSSNGNITVERDNSTSMRNDGNNVDLDIEKANQAANTMKYYALTQQASNKISMTKYVISGGK